jgi:hypothetical protein
MNDGSGFEPRTESTIIASGQGASRLRPAVRPIIRIEARTRCQYGRA